MPRAGRAAAGGYLYHVFNRAAGRKRLFRDPTDYQAFIDTLRSAKEDVRMRIVGYCIMPDHWHLVLWPRKDGDLSRFVLRVATAHVRRYRLRYRVETGDPLYSQRFKSFPIQDDQHLLDVLRFVESNPVREKLVGSARQWAWSSLTQRAKSENVLDAGPARLPLNWEKLLKQPLGPALDEMLLCMQRNRPYGSPAWTRRTSDRLGLESTLRPQGRPRKVINAPVKRGKK